VIIIILLVKLLLVLGFRIRHHTLKLLRWPTFAPGSRLYNFVFSRQELWLSVTFVGNAAIRSLVMPLAIAAA
jgi:hypothetical protein